MTYDAESGKITWPEDVIVLENGDILPLAQKKKDEFMDKLSGAFVKRLKGRWV